jgi:hypothetical protein
MEAKHEVAAVDRRVFGIGRRAGWRATIESAARCLRRAFGAIHGGGARDRGEVTSLPGPRFVVPPPPPTLGQRLGRAVSGGALFTLGLVTIVGSGGGGGDGGSATAGGGGTTSGTAPTITTQPSALSVAAGTSATFSVTASGDAPLVYQWARNGADVAGAASPTLTLLTTAADDGAIFRVVVSNAAGSATSAAATLTVISAGVGTLNGNAVSAANAAVQLAVTATVPDRPAAGPTPTQSFNLSGVPASERIVLRTSAAGHVDQLKIAAVRAGAVSFVRSVLLPVGSSTTLDAAAGGTVTVSGSVAQVVFPANAFERSDNGAAPSGAVTVSATAVAGARDPDRLPGDNTTLDGSLLRRLDSLGALAVTAVDASGQALRLAAGKQATVRVPLSTRSTDAVPASATLYRLNEGDGLWVALGAATLAGSGNARWFERTIDTLGLLNVAREADVIQLIGCTQAGTNRTRNRSVRTEGIEDTFAGYAFTGADGSFSVPVRRNARAVLFTTGGTESTAPIVVGPSATDITLPGCLAERGTLSTAPSFIAAPTSSTVALDGAVRLHAVVDGKLPIGLQWLRNGVPIAGETGTALSFAAGAADNGAVFTVVATNSAGTATSAAAVLTVTGAGGGGGGGGSGQACYNGQPAAGTRFQATYAMTNAGATYGTRTLDVLVGGTAAFEGVSARVSTVDNRSTTVAGGTTTNTVVNESVYVNATGPGEETRYGQQGSYSVNGSAGTSKLVYTPAWVDRVPGLTVGNAVTQTNTVQITGTSNGTTQPPTTVSTTQTTTLVAIETLVVPAGSFQACRYTIDTGGNTVTIWNTAGAGWRLKTVSGVFVEEATAVQLTTP